MVNAEWLRAKMHLKEAESRVRTFSNYFIGRDLVPMISASWYHSWVMSLHYMAKGNPYLGGPTHRGRQNHIDRSMLCRRALVNLISQEHSWLLQRHLCA